MKKILFATSACLLAVGLARADILAGYDFDTSSGDGEDISTSEANVVAANVTATSFKVGIGLTPTYDLSNGPTDGLDAEGDTFGTTSPFCYGGVGADFGFDDVGDVDDLSGAIIDNDYVEFIVTPDGGYKINLESISFRTYIEQLANSADRWAIFSSVDGFSSGSEIASGQTTDVATWNGATNNITVDLSDAKYQDLDEALTFRIYVYGGGESTNSLTLFDKVVVNGTTAKKVIIVGYDFNANAANPAEATSVGDLLTVSPLTSPMDIAFVTTVGDNSGLAADGESLGDSATLGCVGIQVIDATTGSFGAAVSGNDYISFTVTPAEGKGFHLTQLSFKGVIKATTSVDKFALADSNGNMVGDEVTISNVVTSTGGITAYEGFSIDLTGTDFEFISEPTEFRLYAWGRGTSKTSGTITFIDKIALYGEESNNSGRNSHFWVTLLPQAGTPTGASSDLVISNGYRNVNLSSPDLSCTRVDNGSNWEYQIRWTGNSLIDGSAAEPLEFSVLVEAFQDVEHDYGTGTVVALETTSTPSDIDNAWGVGNDFDFDIGESIRMTMQNFKVDGVDAAAQGLLLVENKFTRMHVKETNGGNGHMMILGVGTGLPKKSFVSPTENYEVEGDSFSVTGAGSNTGGKHFAVTKVNFEFILRNPALSEEDPDYLFADIPGGHSFGPTPYEPTSPEKIANAFPKFSWDRIPRTMLIRQNPNFTDEEARRIANRYDIVVLEKYSGGRAGYWSKAEILKQYNPDIKVVFYWNSRIYYGHYGVDDEIEDRWDEFIDPEFTIRNGLDTYNRNNPDLVDWWVGVAHKMMGLVDGTLPDGVTPLQDFENWPETGSPVDGYFIDKTGVPVSMLQPLYEGASDHHFCMNNNSNNRIRLPYLDGTYREGYSGGGNPLKLMEAIAIAKESGKNQKLTMLRNPADSSGNRREMEDSVDNILGYYLAYAEPYAYFYHQKSVYAGDPDWMWLADYHDQFNRPLGAPLGDAYKDAFVYSRSFERCDLYLDLETDTGGKLTRIMWKNDIGSPALAGSGHSNTDYIYTLKGSGHLSGSSDSFFYLSDLHYGNGEVSARIDSLSASNAAAKAGVMFRERNEPLTDYSNWAEDYTAAYQNGTILLPGARMVAVVRNPAGQMEMIYRSATDGALASAGTADASLGSYAKLTRSQDDFVGYCSVDGVTWTEIGQVTLAGMAEKVELGMAVSSEDNGELAEASFSEFNRKQTKPTATAETVSIVEDGGSSAITLSGSDAYGTGLTYTVVSQPSNGTLSGTAPNLVYTPNTNFFGSDTFTFKVNDGFEDSDTVTVTIAVDSVNDAPIANDGSLVVAENIPVDILLTASDPDGDTGFSYTVTTQPANGSLTGTAPDLTYTPDADYLGADSFTYIVNDGALDSGTGTVSISVIPESNDVIAGYDFDDGFGSATTVVTVQDANVTVSDYGVGAGLIDLIDTGSNSLNEVMDAEGNYFGTDNPLSYGGARSTFGFTDMNNGNNLATAVNNNDYMSFTVTPESGHVLNLLRLSFRTRINDVNNSAERWALLSSVDGFASGSQIGSGRTTVESTYVDNVVSLDDTRFQNVDGPIEFRLYIHGGNASTSSATLFDKVILHGNVIVPNAPPVADSDSIATLEDHSVAITLTASDPDGDSLSYTLLDAPINGTLSGTAPNLTYTPDGNFYGSDSLTFSVNDGTVESSVATLLIAVDSVNDLPLANAASASVNEDGAVAITLSGSDIEGDALTYSVNAPSNGSLSGTAPNLTYTPFADYNGADSFTYTVNDGTVDSSAATVTITVDPVNDVAVPEDQSLTVLEDGSVEVVLNATDVDGDSLSYSLASTPANGILTGTPPTLTYTPNSNYNGADTITYYVNDGAQDSGLATVSITVDAVNDAPVALIPVISENIVVNLPYSSALADTVSDVENDPLSFTVVDGPAWLVVESDGSLSGTPSFSDIGLNIWTIQAADGLGGSVEITLNLTVIDPILVAYDFDLGSNAVTLVPASVSASQFTSPMEISYSSTIGDNTGLNAHGVEFGDPATLGAVGIGVNDATTSSFANAVAGNDYMTFTVTPDEGVGLQLSALTFLGIKKATTSVDRYGLADATGNQIGDIGAIASVAGLTSTYDGVIFDLTGTVFETITGPTEFRLYAWGRGTSNTNNTLAALDKLTLHGQVTTAPVAHWALDDGSSATAADSSGNGYDGTISNATSITGVAGTALDFNGSNAEISLPSSAFSSISQEITISLWAYGDTDLPKNHSIFYALDASGNRVLNIHLPWGNSSVYWDAGWDSSYDRIFKVASASQFKGSWSHWVFVKNATAGTMEIYHNGSLFHSGTGKTHAMTGITNGMLGSQGGRLHYSGSIDDLVLYNVALTAEEVAELYNSY